MRRLLIAAFLLATACHSDSGKIPVYVVEPTAFARRVGAEGNLKAKKTTPLAAPQNAPGPLKVAWIADDGAVLQKNDLIARFDPSDFQTMLVDGQENRDTAGNKVVRSVTDASTIRTNLKRDAGQAEEELDEAKRLPKDDAEVFSRNERIESQLDQQLAVDTKEHADNVLVVRDTLSKAELDLLAIDAKKAGLEIRNAQQGLNALELRAPDAGILVLQRDWKGEITRVGATVYSGYPIGEIPDLTAMKAEVFVLEADAAGIAAGQRATIALESNPGVTYTGKVSSIDKLARPRFRGVPVQYFAVTVDLDRTDRAVMKPGARVHAVLEVEDRANAFSIPRQALFDKENRKIVYVRRGSRFNPVDVTIGSSTAGRVMVTKGVARGDALALTDPTKKDEGDHETPSTAGATGR